MRVLLWSCLVLAICCMAALAEEFTDLMRKNMEKCRREHGSSDQEMEKILAGKMSKPEVKNNMKCTIHCFLTKGGFMDADGKFNPEAYKAAYASKQNISDVVDQCKGLSGANPCETAFAINFCIVEHKIDMAQYN